MSQQQPSSSTQEQTQDNDALLEDIFPNQEQVQDNDTPQEQTQDSETPHEQNEDLQSSFKKKTRTTWEVDVINGEGFVKKKKLKVKDVWTLPLGEQIIVPFDNFGTPFTEAAGLFTGTLAGLAQESSSFPINFTDWRLMPKQYKEDIFTKAIKPKFHFHNDVIAKHWTLQNIGRKWKDFKSRLWIEFYDPSLNRDELISKCPIGIHRDSGQVLSTIVCLKNLRKCVEKMLKVGNTKKLHILVDQRALLGEGLRWKLSSGTVLIAQNYGLIPTKYKEGHLLMKNVELSP
nr:uncharacterized LOC107815048 [Ipomoea batatas]